MSTEHPYNRITEASGTTDREVLTKIAVAWSRAASLTISHAWQISRHRRIIYDSDRGVARCGVDKGRSWKALHSCAAESNQRLRNRHRRGVKSCKWRASTEQHGQWAMPGSKTDVRSLTTWRDNGRCAIRKRRRDDMKGGLCHSPWRHGIGIRGVTVTSQSLWSRYDRHFVGVTRHNVLFCSLAVHDSRVGHTMDVLSPFIST